MSRRDQIYGWVEDALGGELGGTRINAIVDVIQRVAEQDESEARREADAFTKVLREIANIEQPRGNDADEKAADKLFEARDRARRVLKAKGKRVEPLDD
jgi:hypothetical protein